MASPPNCGSPKALPYTPLDPSSSHRTWLKKLPKELSHRRGREAPIEQAVAVTREQLPRVCVWQQLEPGPGLLNKRKWRRKVFISKVLWGCFDFLSVCPQQTDTLSSLTNYIQQIGGRLDTCLNQTAAGRRWELFFECLLLLFNKAMGCNAIEL